jgi:uncharacterized protein with HEPN domain
MSNKIERDIELFIVDVFVAIKKINNYTDDFQHSGLHWDATIRQLEIIGEALNKLLDDDKFKLIAPSYFRNAIAHGYFGIDLDEVWNIIQVVILIVENCNTIPTICLR